MDEKVCTNSSLGVITSIILCLLLNFGFSSQAPTAWSFKGISPQVKELTPNLSQSALGSQSPTLQKYQIKRCFLLDYQYNHLDLALEVYEFPNKILSYGAYLTLGNKATTLSAALKQRVFWAGPYLIVIRTGILMGWTAEEFEAWLKGINPPEFLFPDIWKKFPQQNALAFSEGVIASHWMNSQDTGIYAQRSYRSVNCQYTLSKRIQLLSSQELHEILNPFQVVQTLDLEENREVYLVQQLHQLILFYWKNGRFLSVYGCPDGNQLQQIAEDFFRLQDQLQ